jgi:1-acyl-sn-glycerol-3-phosphate acyltransferase
VLAVWLLRFGYDRRHRRDLASRARWLQSCAQATLRVIGVRVSTFGAPTDQSLIVANHVSYLDIVVLAATTPVVFIAKREVRSWPVFGWFALLAGTRFIDREKRGDVSRVVAELAPILAAGVSIVLFPEGTSTDGSSVKAFKTSLFEPAVQQGWRVTPAALSYSVPLGYSAKREVCWWGDMTLPPHLLNLLGLPRIDASVAWGSAESAHGDRKAFGAHLHRRVAHLHAAIGSGPPRPWL